MLHDHTDLESFNAKVDAIPLMGSITRIDRALRLAQEDFFSPKNGGRPDVSKIIFLLTGEEFLLRNMALNELVELF